MTARFAALPSLAARAIAPLALTATVVGCGGGGISQLLISDQQEQEIGAGVHDQLAAEYKLANDNDPVTLWANQLVQYMVPHSEQFRPSSNIGGYKVAVINDPTLVNAFAAPGGYVYIATGLVVNATSCAEVAGVVGHELAHVTQRHSVKAMTKGAAVGGIADLILGEGISANVINLAWSFLQNTTFSQKAEAESDKIGTTIMHDSGYNPYALAHMFETLADLSAGKEPPKFLSSHPASKDRAASIRRQIEKSWGDTVTEDANPDFEYGCLGTTLTFDDVIARINAGQVTTKPGTGTKPPSP